MFYQVSLPAELNLWNVYPRLADFTQYSAFRLIGIPPFNQNSRNLLTYTFRPISQTLSSRQNASCSAVLFLILANLSLLKIIRAEHSRRRSNSSKAKYTVGSSTAEQRTNARTRECTGLPSALLSPLSSCQSYSEILRTHSYQERRAPENTRLKSCYNCV